MKRGHLQLAEVLQYTMLTGIQSIWGQLYAQAESLCLQEAQASQSKRAAILQLPSRPGWVS